MESILEEYLDYLRIEKGFSEGTITGYRLDIGSGLIPFLFQLGKRKMKEVLKDDIKAYMNFLATVKNNAAISRARKLAAIKSFFNYLVESGELEANPASSIRAPRIMAAVPIYLNENECLLLIESVARTAKPMMKERDVAIILLFLHTGVRVSELTSLKLADTDLEVRQIKVTRKGNKEQYLPLNSEAVDALAKYIPKRPRNSNGILFVGTNGDSLHRVTVYSIVKKYLKLAGINKNRYGPHLLRHTFCTRLHQKKTAPFIIKNLAGHENLNTTMKYVNIENEELIDAVSRLRFGVLEEMKNKYETMDSALG